MKNKKWIIWVAIIVIILIIIAVIIFRKPADSSETTNTATKGTAPIQTPGSAQANTNPIVSQAISLAKTKWVGYPNIIDYAVIKLPEIFADKENNKLQEKANKAGIAVAEQMINEVSWMWTNGIA